MYLNENDYFRGDQLKSPKDCKAETG